MSRTCTKCETEMVLDCEVYSRISTDQGIGLGVNYLHQNHLRLFWKRLLIFKISIGLSTFISIDIHTNPLYPATQFAVLSTIPEGLCRLLLILIRFILFWILITFLSDFLEVFLACLTHTFLGFERIL